MKQVFSNINVQFQAIQFTENWKENETLKAICRNYKGAFSVASTKQTVEVGDYVLVSEGATLVVSEKFLKENFSDEEQKISITMDEEDDVVAVSLQNEEGQILELLWQADPKLKKQESAARPEEEKVHDGQKSPADAEREDQRAVEYLTEALKKEGMAVMADCDVLLEKRIDRIRKLVASAAPEHRSGLVQYMQEAFEIDVDDHKKPSQSAGHQDDRRQKHPKHPVKPHARSSGAFRVLDPNEKPRRKPEAQAWLKINTKFAI